MHSRSSMNSLNGRTGSFLAILVLGSCSHPAPSMNVTEGDNTFPVIHGSSPVEVGYRDFSYETSPSSTPTGKKPESKLWWNDGFWWGSLYNNVKKEYHIYRLGLPTQCWTDTGTVLDDRGNSKADVLWDDANQKLYVASHVFTSNARPWPTRSQWGRLYLFTYVKSTQSNVLDEGFPVDVTQGKAETLVLAKDSFSRLWVTFVEDGKVDDQSKHLE